MTTMEQEATSDVTDPSWLSTPIFGRCTNIAQPYRPKHNLHKSGLNVRSYPLAVEHLSVYCCHVLALSLLANRCIPGLPYRYHLFPNLDHA